jgi:hypothetical protein
MWRLITQQVVSKQFGVEWLHMTAATPATCAESLLPICKVTNAEQICHDCKKEYRDKPCGSAHSLSYPAGWLHHFLQPN